jgi:hypothetical protein
MTDFDVQERCHDRHRRMINRMHQVQVFTQFEARAKGMSPVLRAGLLYLIYFLRHYIWTYKIHVWVNMCHLRLIEDMQKVRQHMQTICCLVLVLQKPYNARLT